MPLQNSEYLLKSEKVALSR